MIKDILELLINKDVQLMTNKHFYNGTLQHYKNYPNRFIVQNTIFDLTEIQHIFIYYDYKNIYF